MATATAPKTAPPTDTDEQDSGEVRYTRLSVNIALEVAAALRALTRRRNITATEGIRRAIAVWKLVEDELEAGNSVQIVNAKTGKARELILL